MLIGHFHDVNLVSQACRVGKDFGQWNNIPLCLMILFILIRSEKHIYSICMGTTVAQWLRCCATNWKVAGSIPDGVIGIFH